MINISMRDNVSCENVCKAIEKEVQLWRKENGGDLSDCFLNISIVKVSHTIENPKTIPTMTHTATEDQI